MTPIPFPIPLLHVGGTQPTGPLYTHWILDPAIAVALLAITAAYLAWTGPLNRRRPDVALRPVTGAQQRWFHFGTLIALVALGPPLDDWSHFFFVSAHMLQHLLLMFAVVPCWIKGIPPWMYQPIIDRKWSRWLLLWVPRAVPGFAMVALIMAIWHVPSVYDAALEHEPIHAAQHAFFLFAGFLFYWPLMSTRPETPQLNPPLKCLYLFLQTIPAGILGALITYAGPGLYPWYERATVRPWGIDLKTDQEIAGLVMWVGMNTLFLLMLTIIFLRWANGEEARDKAELREETRVYRESKRAPGESPNVPAGAAELTSAHPITH